MGRGSGSDLLVGRRSSTQSKELDYPLRSDAVYSDPRYDAFPEMGRCPVVASSKVCSEQLFLGYCPIHGEISFHSNHQPELDPVTDEWVEVWDEITEDALLPIHKRDYGSLQMWQTCFEGRKHPQTGERYSGPPGELPKMSEWNTKRLERYLEKEEEKRRKKQREYRREEGKQKLSALT